MTKVLIGCEFSGTVRDAFTKLGHDAVSCDLLPTDIPGKHYQGDLRDLLNESWDIGIFHPPCTDLAVSGAKHFYRKIAAQETALNFVREIMAAPIPRKALENPVSIISTRIRKPDQIIQPYQFGHFATKRTCLWLDNLPKLKPTHFNINPYACPSEMHLVGPSETRWKIRSKTYQGIANAMAVQWGDNLAV
jgi:hypothetical protein